MTLPDFTATNQALQVNGTMDRKPNLQTVTWLLNLQRFGQLDLNPPYQRKSVWSRKERQRFIDTVIRNYPSPAIFLHVTYSPDGRPEYHVVDGKQRLTAILDFAENKLRLAANFGDTRLNGKRWMDLEEYPALRKSFWNYKLTVEEIDDVAEPVVREVFERLNRNSRKLEPQEMRHARFDGWLISFLEVAAESSDWKDLRLWTATRAKRMFDVQILSELAAVALRNQIHGFDQVDLDELYATFDDIEPSDGSEFDSESFIERFEEGNRILRGMDRQNSCIEMYGRTLVHLYPLWAILILDADRLPDCETLAARYSDFMASVQALQQMVAQGEEASDSFNPDVRRYLGNMTGASTEEPQRRARYEALRAQVLGAAEG